MKLILNKDYSKPGWTLQLVNSFGEILDLKTGPLHELLRHLKKHIGDSMDGALK